MCIPRFNFGESQSENLESINQIRIKEENDVGGARREW
jgi:hypothetical protein